MTPNQALNIILPDWPVPKAVRALSTTRIGGVSKGEFKSFNLAYHVGDSEESVKQNRAILRRDWLLPTEPHWLNQTHSTEVLELTDKTHLTQGDASWTAQRDIVCTVMTADCLPLLVYQPNENKVAAIHAGWRGLLNGIIERSIRAMTSNPEATLVWLGPAIGPRVFEVGSEVYQAFCEVEQDAASCFKTYGDKFLADIYGLARQRLNTLGITQIFGGQHCTFEEPDRFYSYRRDGQTGRMASLIWMEAP